MGQVIFNSTNLIMPYQFVQNKFVQEFVAVSLLFEGYVGREKVARVMLHTSIQTHTYICEYVYVLRVLILI